MTQPHSSEITIGIQGGRGSFNEAALEAYLEKHQLKKNKVTREYLYTSERVLNAISQQEVDLGIFALYNTVGGFVAETLTALGSYQFSIVETISLPIEHCLMKRKDISFDQITIVMAHPHAIKQCASTLKEKYGFLKIKSGTGDLIDHAKVAEELAAGNLSQSTAVIGSALLAKIYNLDIVDTKMKDSETNITTFCVVQPKKLQLENAQTLPPDHRESFSADEHNHLGSRPSYF